MKYTKIFAMQVRIYLCILTLMIISLFSSCARKINFSESSVVPAARGYVKIKKDNNNNYAFKIQISDLAEVSRLQPPRRSYVLWMVTSEGKTKNLGRLKSSTELLSKKLEASFETVSSFKPTQIFITAEDDENVQFPGTQVILSTRIF